MIDLAPCGLVQKDNADFKLGRTVEGSFELFFCARSSSTPLNARLERTTSWLAAFVRSVAGALEANGKEIVFEPKT
eukprot:2394599-Amphidinium_carterae.1